ncbi:hypothetical protein GWE_04680 [Chlamydia psittaci NJ1]|nr:hypothetical protein B712_0188 [Chlamydia psittaci NJ1]KPZ36570.1 hypothetical protein GWE_04680 [Chlamydia psittaci NJ1]
MVRRDTSSSSQLFYLSGRFLVKTKKTEFTPLQLVIKALDANLEWVRGKQGIRGNQERNCRKILGGRTR